MTPFEEQLKQVLERQEPSEDFTARVLARCAEEDARKKSGFLQRMGLTPAWRMAAATLTAALCVTVGANLYRDHEHEVKGLEAKRQLLLAMHITQSKLQHVQEQLNANEEATQ